MEIKALEDTVIALKECLRWALSTYFMDLPTGFETESGSKDTRFHLDLDRVGHHLRCEEA